MERIEAEFGVFLRNGQPAIGAVREAPAGGSLIRIYIENAGDFDVPRTAIIYAGEGKVVLDPAKLSPALLAAAGHAHDAEDPQIADRGTEGDVV